MTQLFAQATSLPNNGASNAEDFQPQTQNPQQVPSNVQQQQSGTLQDTTSQEVLSATDSRIIVPQTSAQTVTPVQTAPEAGGVNWFLIGIFLIAVIACSWFVKKALKNKPTHFAEPEQEQEPTQEPEPMVAEVEEPKPAPKPVTVKTEPETQKSKKKKSKSKRKKSRK